MCFGLKVEGKHPCQVVYMAQVEVLFLAKVLFLSACCNNNNNKKKSSDTSQTKCIHSGRTESKKSALGGMWRERRPLDLCCIVIEASQVFQTGPVTELVLVLGRKRGERGISHQERAMGETLPEELGGRTATADDLLLSERWLASECAAS